MFWDGDTAAAREKPVYKSLSPEPIGDLEDDVEGKEKYFTEEELKKSIRIAPV